MRKRKKRKKIGNSLAIRAAAWCLILGLAAALPSLSGGEKPKKSNAYSVVAGTVFKETGLSLPGAIVTLAPAPAEGAGYKGKPMSFVSDRRGEFAFRVAPVAAKYIVSATLKGYSSETKTVSVNPEERIDVTFTLREESK